MQSDDSSAAEQWRETLRDFKAERGMTHKDFFDSLVHDIADRGDFHASQREPHPEDRLELVSGLQRQVEEVVHRTLDEAEKEFAAHQTDASSEANDELVLDGALLDEVCAEVLAVLEADGSIALEDLGTHLNESLSFLYYQPINKETRLLLLQAIEIELHDHVVRTRKDMGEDAGEESSRSPQDFELDELNDRELDQKDGLSAGTPSHKPIVYDDSSSSTEPHSPKHATSTHPAGLPTPSSQATPSSRPIQTRTPAKTMQTPAKAMHTPAADPTEGVPAWDLPKSPLDPLFRKGYGGLGQSDLQEVIDLLTPHRRSRRGEEDLGDDDGDYEEEGETSDASSQHLVQTVHTPGQHHPTATRQEAEDEDDFIGIDDLPDPDTFAQATTARLHGSKGRLQRYLAEEATTIRIESRSPPSPERQPSSATKKKTKKTPTKGTPTMVKPAKAAASATTSSSASLPQPATPPVGATRLAKKAANGQALRSAPGRLTHSSRRSEKVAEGESHVRAILLDGEEEEAEVDEGDKPMFTRSSSLNALLQQAYAEHVHRYSRPSQGGVQVAYSPTDEKVYAFDEEARQEDSDDSIDTEEYHAMLSSPSNVEQLSSTRNREEKEQTDKPIKKTSKKSPSKVTKKKKTKQQQPKTKEEDEEEGKAEEVKKTRPKSRHSEPLPTKASLDALPSTRPKTAKKTTGTTSRPTSAGRTRVGGASTESRLLEPTAASKQWARK